MKQGLRKMMTAICAAVFVTALILNCAGFKAAAFGVRYVPGTYEGTGQGFRGPVQVAVRLDANGITGIEILKFDDEYLPGGAAMEELLELVLDMGDTDVDAVSGATESSAGFLSAVEDALRKAGSITP
ncbi:FMN-binding protein [Spirochaetia bacterium]|nr:FMN-binding protein [Spirochaetia bacterium]